MLILKMDGENTIMMQKMEEDEEEHK